MVLRNFLSTFLIFSLVVFPIHIQATPGDDEGLTLPEISQRLQTLSRSLLAFKDKVYFTEELSQYPDLLLEYKAVLNVVEKRLHILRTALEKFNYTLDEYHFYDNYISNVLENIKNEKKYLQQNELNFEEFKKTVEAFGEEFGHFQESTWEQVSRYFTNLYLKISDYLWMGTAALLGISFLYLIWKAKLSELIFPPPPPMSLKHVKTLNINSKVYDFLVLKNSYILSGTSKGHLQIWGLTSFRSIHVSKNKHTEMIYKMTLSSDGKTLATSGLDGPIKIWKVTARDPHTQQASSSVLRTSVDFSETLQTANKDAPTHYYDLTFSPDGKYLAAGNDYNEIYIWDQKSKKYLYGLAYGKTHSMSFNAQTNDLVSIHHDPLTTSLHVWKSDFKNNKPLNNGPEKNIKYFFKPLKKTPIERKHKVCHLHTKSKSTLYSISKNRLYLWYKNSEGLTESKLYRSRKPYPFSSLTCDQQSQLLLIGDEKGLLHIYNPTTQELLLRTKVHDQAVTKAIIVKEKKRVVTSSYDGNIKIFEYKYKDEDKSE